ncbi:MAG: YidC/Oxa1 family membrane protein insertase [Solirubrobacteraceae bacterium]
MFVLANIVQPLIDVFEEFLLAIHAVVGSWGLSIVLLTVIVRAALLPLTFKQFKSMQNMQRLAPEIKALQEKYKDDKQRMNQEMMKFYQENNVNPLSSCLPLVAQFPVFIALFYMLQKDLRRDICPGLNPTGTANPKPCGEAGDAGFLFIPDLTNKATGAVLVALIVLYVGSQVVSTLMMSVTADKNQRRLFLALPLVFVFFILNFPAGLIVYWITTNTWTIAQQYIVRKTVGPLRPPPATVEGEGSGGLGGLFGGLLGGGTKPASPDGKAGSDDGKSTARAAKGSAGTTNGKAAAPSGPKAKPPAPPRKKRKQRSGRRR